MKAETREACLRAAAIVEGQEGIAKNDAFRDPCGEYCMLGAIYAAMGVESEENMFLAADIPALGLEGAAYDVVVEFSAWFRGEYGLEPHEWNDLTTTQTGDVVRLLREVGGGR